MSCMITRTESTRTGSFGNIPEKLSGRLATFSLVFAFVNLIAACGFLVGSLIEMTNGFFLSSMVLGIIAMVNAALCYVLADLGEKFSEHAQSLRLGSVA